MSKVVKFSVWVSRYQIIIKLIGKIAIQIEKRFLVILLMPAPLSFLSGLRRQTVSVYSEIVLESVATIDAA